MKKLTKYFLAKAYVFCEIRAHRASIAGSDYVNWTGLADYFEKRFWENVKKNYKL